MLVSNEKGEWIEEPYVLDADNMTQIMTQVITYELYAGNYKSDEEFVSAVEKTFNAVIDIIENRLNKKPSADQIKGEYATGNNNILK